MAGPENDLRIPGNAASNDNAAPPRPIDVPLSASFRGCADSGDNAAAPDPVDDPLSNFIDWTAECGDNAASPDPVDVGMEDFRQGRDEELSSLYWQAIAVNQHDGDSSFSFSSESVSDDEVESLSEDDNTKDLLEVRVWCDKGWQTDEDVALSRIDALAKELRDKPLLPPHPENAQESWVDTTSGIALPLCHCAFRGCPWVSQQVPCDEKLKQGSYWQGRESQWKLSEEKREDPCGLLACCDDAACLREHLVRAHSEVFFRICGEDARTLDIYSYYLEALCVPERKSMPLLGCSIDRRVFRQIAEDFSEDTAQALLCMCCNCIKTTSNGNTEIAYINAFEYFNTRMIRPESFDWNWDMQKYRERYVVKGGDKNPLRNDPDLAEDVWTWRRIVPATSNLPERVIICSPEDVRCPRRHQQMHVLCYECEIALCRRCLLTSSSRSEYAVPEALANDNYWGYVTSVIYKYKVRWIEAAAASPIFTALITFYAEGDRGHLMDELLHQPQRAYNVRGNCFSFNMPWEGIVKQLEKVLQEGGGLALPHPPNVLSSMVLFSLRIGNCDDFNTWIPQARLRPHVVLKLCLALIDAGYPFKGSAQELGAQFRRQVQERYPETEGHLPEDEREGRIPKAVEEAMRQSLRPLLSDQDGSGFNRKHATPGEAPRLTPMAFEDVRPSSAFPDRNSANMVPLDASHLVAVRKHYLLNAATDVDLVKQWETNFFAEAFPFSIGRRVGGADFPYRTRPRRVREAASLEPMPWARMLATRAEASIRNDWLAVPSARNLCTKFTALCGKDLACKHIVDADKPGEETAVEVTEAAEALYDKLKSGYWWDGRKRKRINHDVTKLQYALNLSNVERRLIKDMQFLSSTVPGTQQIRLQIGHALFGARVELGDPLFLTISPSSRHSGFTIKVSRYRESDPAVRFRNPSAVNLTPWHKRQRPHIWQDPEGSGVYLDLPMYDVRKVLVAKDPWAVIQNFTNSTKFLLPKLLGYKMCPLCPHCNVGTEHSPCANKFGHNLTPTGGVAGLSAGFGGAVEYQMNDDPHLHGNVHLVTMYQYLSLEEIAELMVQNIVTLENITQWQAWICRTEHFDQAKHDAALPELEKTWQQHNKDGRADALCCLPQYLAQQPAKTLW
jgi:hypothetical protein